MNSFQKLKTILNSVSGNPPLQSKTQLFNKRISLDLQDIDSNTFLTPFLDIIRSDETSGPITCLALNAVNKFLSYGLIGIDSLNLFLFPNLFLFSKILKVNLPHLLLIKSQTL
jgi:hypothetical protein